MGDITVQLTDNSDLVKAAKDEMIARALEAVGLQAEGNVIPLVPVDTGRLKNSITHVVEGETAYVGTNVEYAPYVPQNLLNMVRARCAHSLICAQA